MKLSAIQEALRREGIDGWLFFDHHRRDPLAYRILQLPSGLMATRRWYYLIPAEGEPRGLVHKIESHSLESLPGDIRAYAQWTEQHDGLKRLLSGMKRVAMEYSANCAIPYISLVDGGTIELVRSFQVEVVASADLVQQFEASWTAEQLESHLAAGRVIDRIRAGAFDLIREKLSNSAPLGEIDVKQFVLDQIAANDLFTDHGPIVAVNGNASDPHYEPSPEKTSPIRPNDFVLIDMWAKSTQPDAVYYDITWTGYCGATAPDEIQKVFEVVKGGRNAAIEKVKDSVSRNAPLAGFEVDDAARSFIQARGYGDYFVHRTGHSIGTEVHGTGANMDNFETHDTRRVIPNTCFSVEPGVYLPKFGIRSEVNVFVGDGEARVTGEMQDRLLTLA